MSKFIHIENSNDDFNFFIQNLKSITYFNKGTFGFTFILEIKDDIESLYEYIESKQKIKKVLLKICGICGEGNCDTKKRITISNINISTLSVPALEKECELQNKVYDCGEEHGEQLCPKMFYCENMDITKSTTFLTQLIPLVNPVKKTGFFSRFTKPDPPSKEYVILNGILQNLSQIDGLYVSLMEYADGYVTLSQLNYEEKYLQNYARAALLKLALYCSISHNDPNKDNILINKLNNHVLLIDFGSTIEQHNKEEITPGEKTQIITNIKSGNYMLALQMCNKMYKQEFDYRGEPSFSPLQWVHDSADKTIIQPIIQPIIDSLPGQDAPAPEVVPAPSHASEVVPEPAHTQTETKSVDVPLPKYDDSSELDAIAPTDDDVQFTCYYDLLREDSEYFQILYINNYINNINIEKAKIILVDHNKKQCYNVTYKREFKTIVNGDSEYTYYDNNNTKIIVKQSEIKQDSKPDTRFKYSLFVNKDIIPNKPEPKSTVSDDEIEIPRWAELQTNSGVGGGGGYFRKSRKPRSIHHKQKSKKRSTRKSKKTLKKKSRRKTRRR